MSMVLFPPYESVEVIVLTRLQSGTSKHRVKIKKTREESRQSEEQTVKGSA